MASAGSLLFPKELGFQSNFLHSIHTKEMTERGRLRFITLSLSSHASLQDAWSLHVLNSVRTPLSPIPTRCNPFLCRSFIPPTSGYEIPVLKSASTILTRSYNALCGRPLLLQMVPAAGIIAFAILGLGPLLRVSRSLLFQKSDSSWNKSRTHHVMTNYIQPLLLWSGAILICRALDPIILPTEASQAVKQRVLNFVRSLSSVLAFAYCLSSLIREIQKFFMETNDSDDTRTMGLDFAGKAAYSAVWVAAISLFMELLGFSTQKWVTAGGLGTVLLTLAGREIFTNFLSSIMIHATRPFVLNNWIQTKIEGYEVSGTVEHVGWWSPTIIRGDDREAVHIPNHKFTVNVVRNLSQKTHWRIKTHLAISHLDVNKINSIVPDMRKVLAKNPQVEQQKLHRRVFLDNIDPENQALLIMVSCFVKTSHFEEYLCVKEAVLLDLLRVISHHRARLATPIRTVQKVYSDTDIDIPFSDTFFGRKGPATNRPYLLIDSYKITSDDKTKTSTRGVAGSEEKDEKVESSASTLKSKSDTTKTGAIPKSDNIKTSDVSGSASNTGTSIAGPASDGLPSTSNSEASSESGQETPVKVSTSDEVAAISSSTGNSGSNHKTPVKGSTGALKKNSDKPSSTTSADGPSSSAISKQEGDKPVASRPDLEENIVLNVALEGSKRTLPIEEEMIPSPVLSESKELAGCLNGNGNGTSAKEKDDQGPSSPGVASSNPRDQ